MIKKRKKCFVCGAKKYTKYLRIHPVSPALGRKVFCCKNSAKCNYYHPNYKK